MISVEILLEKLGGGAREGKWGYIFSEYDTRIMKIGNVSFCS